jgi:phosphoglycolate phosphatase-like HAD superfamily hydrolase
MTSSFFWQRPNLIVPSDLDTILFDIDNTLLQTVDSFHATDIATAEYVAGVLHGLDWGQAAGQKLLTHDDVQAFKQAGGYNNDWDMCYMLAALCVARLREWCGTELAARSYADWAALSYAANLQGRGGLTWVRDTIPSSALPDYELVGQIYREFYWGAKDLFDRYGQLAHFIPNFPGFARTEKPFCPPDFFARLRTSGIRHMGIITGRVGPEVDAALEMLEEHSGERWWQVVIPADLMPKPDPRALQMALAGLASPPQAALYIGDTADDLALVLNYRAVKQANEPEVLAVSVASPEERELYMRRGADYVVGDVNKITSCLP